MDGMLSQEEINALLSGMDSNSDTNEETETKTEDELLTNTEKDIIGEISNISMGTAATTLFSLVNQKVTITTPKVSYCNWKDLVNEYDKPFVFIQIFYKEGLDGNNILMIKENDSKIITDLMMGGDGTNTEGEFSDLHLSAISEAMNQMIGSAATSMSSMLDKKIDINPPVSNLVDLNDEFDAKEIATFLKDSFIKVSFKMKIGDLVDSEIMQLYPIEFAKKITDIFIEAKENENKEKQNPSNQEQPENTKIKTPPPQIEKNVQQTAGQQIHNPNLNQSNANNQQPYRDINVQPAQFQNFDMSQVMQQKENIDLIMDVPLQVTVELGKTHKSIKEILEFSPGTILELDKLAGEPIDVLVNGKLVAKGEVVVIDENFGIRITDIIKYK
ncbi:MAG: flagellar motor switch phosphatase FliY [Eubacteriales bacterium]